MKKVKVCTAIMLFFLFLLPGCKQKGGQVAQEPDILQIKAICNLATLECYYNNVAKVKKEGVGLQVDRTFWVEYTGVAKIGIDMSDVKMEIKGSDVKVTLPNAELLGVDILEESLNEKSFVSSEKGVWIFNTKFSPEDQTNALRQAQENMGESVKNNKSLLINARDRAQKLIENYIDKMGEMSGVEYKITWEYATDSSNA